MSPKHCLGETIELDLTTYMSHSDANDEAQLAIGYDLMKFGQYAAHIWGHGN